MTSIEDPVESIEDDLEEILNSVAESANEHPESQYPESLPNTEFKWTVTLLDKESGKELASSTVTDKISNKALIQAYAGVWSTLDECYRWKHILAGGVNQLLQSHDEYTRQLARLMRVRTKIIHQCTEERLRGDFVDLPTIGRRPRDAFEFGVNEHKNIRMECEVIEDD